MCANVSDIEQEFGEPLRRNASENLGKHVGKIVTGVNLDGVDDTVMLLLADGKLSARNMPRLRTTSVIAGKRIHCGVIHVQTDGGKLRVMNFVG